jgi:hypothetical protein
MRFPLVAAAVVALLLPACNGPGKPKPDIGPQSTPVETPQYTAVIISGDAAAQSGFLFDKAVTGYWEPSLDDISKAEERIRQYLVSAQDDPNLDTYHRESAAFIVANLEQYRHQYLGIVVDGAKRIWCNSFFSDRSFPDWERVPVCVLDGGRYFWQIEYDLSKDECINFYVHGEA